MLENNLAECIPTVVPLIDPVVVPALLSLPDANGVTILGLAAELNITVVVEFIVSFATTLDILDTVSGM